MNRYLIILTAALIIAGTSDYAQAKGLRGCCSNHGGVAGCDDEGNVICNDGTYSPSCKCENSDSSLYFGGDNTNKQAGVNRDSGSYYTYGNSGYTDFTRKKPVEDEPYKKSTWFLLTAEAGCERYYFIPLSMPDDTAFSEVKTDIKPIDLLYAEINASIPLFFFKSLYKYQYTDKGIIDDTERIEFIDDLTDNSKLQYLLTVAAGLIGIEISYSHQVFTVGQYSYYRSSETPDILNYNTGKSRNILISEDPLISFKNQVDIKYHFYWWDIPQYGGIKQSETGADLFVGYKYIQYKTPVIVYTYNEMEEIVGESLPQQSIQTIHMAGIGINNNKKPVEQGFNFVFGLELYAGYGYTFCNLNDWWYLPSELPSGYDPAQDRNTKLEYFSLEPGGNMALIFCLTNGYFVTNIKAEYEVSMFLNFIETGDEYTYSTGDTTVDIYQSIKVSAEITF